jgi:hypothetical protein
MNLKSRNMAKTMGLRPVIHPTHAGTPGFWRPYGTSFIPAHFEATVVDSRYVTCTLEIKVNDSGAPACVGITTASELTGALLRDLPIETLVHQAAASIAEPLHPDPTKPYRASKKQLTREDALKKIREADKTLRFKARRGETIHHQVANVWNAASQGNGQRPRQAVLAVFRNVPVRTLDRRIGEARDQGLIRPPIERRKRRSNVDSR